jgi:3-methyladenine DNA glycosylase AlkD
MTSPLPLLTDSHSALIQDFQQRCDRAADPATKDWFEAYLKGVIPYRGLKLPQVKTIFKAWYPCVEALPLPEQVAMALALLAMDYAEDKLAGIVWLEERLGPRGAIGYQADLPRLARLFQSGAIADWSTCDWFCVRVLQGMVQREGADCAVAIAAWREAENLWQRRASCIPFVGLAKRGEENFTGFTGLMLTVAETVVQSPERFAQTGVGWLLRELWRSEPERVVAFVEQHLGQFSAEGLRYTTEKMPRSEQLRLRAMRKAQGV